MGRLTKSLAGLPKERRQKEKEETKVFTIKINTVNRINSFFKMANNEKEEVGLTT